MAAASPSDDKPRRALPLTIVVVASLIGLISVFAVWAKRQLLETDTWTETSSELIQNAEIRSAVADYAVTQLFDNVNVQAAIASKLPPEARPLAAPAAGALRQLAGEAALKALEEPTVQSIWVDANRAAHGKLIQLIDDKGQFVSTTGGTVTLDLGGIVAAVAAQTGLPNLSSRLPPDIAQLQVLQSDQLSAAQSVVKLLRTLAWVLTALTLALYALAIYLARARRRETLRAIGLAFVAVGALILFAHDLAGNAVTNSLAVADASKPAIQATWDIVTSLLSETAQSIILDGVFILIAAWLAGPTRAATWIREAIAPYFRRPAIAYGSLAALLALIFRWDPTVGTHRLVPSVIMVALLALGFEILRRQVIREFPDRVRAYSAEGIARGLADRMREARERRMAAAAPAPPAADDRVSQLERLGRLRESGILTDPEFESEKKRILEAV